MSCLRQHSSVMLVVGWAGARPSSVVREWLWGGVDSPHLQAQKAQLRGPLALRWGTQREALAQGCGFLLGLSVWPGSSLAL